MRDNVVVINLRQVVTAENSSNESIGNPSQQRRQRQAGTNATEEEDMMIVDSIETMVLPQTPPFNNTSMKVTIDESDHSPPVMVDESVASETTDPCSNANANADTNTNLNKDDLEYGNTSRHLRSSLRPSSYPTSPNNSNTILNAVSSGSQEDNASYNKYDRPSRLRSTLMTLVGVVLIVGGLVWALIIFFSSPEYITTTSGTPLAAVLCSRMERDVVQQNASAWIVDYVPQYQQECNVLRERQKRCSFAISYTFAVGDAASDSDDDISSSTKALTQSNITTNTATDIAVETRLIMGFDVWTFDSGDECHESVASSRQTYLQSQNLTIFYDYGNPEAKNHYHQPPTAGAIAGIIAGIACGVGILFLCTSVLECILI